MFVLLPLPPRAVGRHATRAGPCTPAEHRSPLVTPSRSGPRIPCSLHHARPLHPNARPTVVPRPSPLTCSSPHHHYHHQVLVMAHYCMGLRHSACRLSGRPAPPSLALPRPDRRGMVRTALACKAVRVAAYLAWGAGLMPVPSLLWNMAQMGVDAGSEATMRPLAERVGGAVRARASAGRMQGTRVVGGRQSWAGCCEWDGRRQGGLGGREWVWVLGRLTGAAWAVPGGRHVRQPLALRKLG